MTESSRWEPPPRFDDFELLGPLGRGGMGHVHLAREISLDREVAIKFIAAENPDPTSVRRFEREARAIAKLGHENVVQVYRVGSVEGRPYLAYEFVRGQTLEFHKNALPWETVLGIGVGLARGLAAVHQVGIVHRDIKPANLMVNEAGLVKLLDFGLAQGQTGSLEPSRGEGRARGATREGLIAGTPAFMAPELFSGRPATFRSDVFSTGLVLYDLLTGDRSRHGLSLPTLALQAQDGFPPIASLVPDLPKALCRVIDHCLRVVPYERPDSGMKLKEELEPLATVLLGRTRNLAVDAPETRLVSESLARIWPELDAFTSRLYETLFRERPAYRRLFPPNLDDQRRKLGHALRLAIDGLRTPERIRSSLGDLGRQHRGYGVSLEDLSGLGPFLLATLREFDAARWDEELERAWTDAWTFILTAMQSGYGLSEGTLITETHAGLASPLLPTPATDPPLSTEYLETESTVLAYRHFGSGPHDLLVLPGLLSHLEKSWSGAAEARYLKELGTQGSVLVFDRRGAGLTDRSGGPPSPSEALEDVLALLDATKVHNAVVIAAGDSVPLGLALLAKHPTRFRAGVLIDGYAKLEVAADNQDGIPKEELDAREADLAKSWGGRAWLARLAPSEIEDEDFLEWFGDYSRASGNPREVRRALMSFRAADARQFLEEIAQPTLVLHRQGDLYVPMALGRNLASKLVRSEFVALEGSDHLPFAGDQELLLLHLFRFLNGLDFDTH